MRRLVALAGLCLAAAGCQEKTTPPPRRVATLPGRTEPPVSITPARYETVIAFAGFGRLSTHVYFRLENRTTADSLFLDYRGWLTSGATWTPVLDEQRVIDVPRAAWRILPVGPLRIVVGDGGELQGLGLGRRPTPLWLESGPVVADWSSATGQREAMRLASIRTGEQTQAGLLFFSQTAWPEAGPVPERMQQVFVVGDTLGDGFILLRGGPSAPHGGPRTETPTVLRAYVDGTDRRWDTVDVTSVGSSTPATRWSLTVPGAGLAGELSVRRPGVRIDRAAGEAVAAPEEPSPGAGSEVPRLLQASGWLMIGPERRSFSGLCLESSVR